MKITIRVMILNKNYIHCKTKYQDYLLISMQNSITGIAIVTLYKDYFKMKKKHTDIFMYITFTEFKQQMIQYICRFSISIRRFIFVYISLNILQLLPEYQVAHERAVYKAIAIVADTKKVIQNMDIEKLSELRGMNKPILDIEDLMTAIIMICKSFNCMNIG